MATEENIKKALEAAVNAIYFDDNSDFGSALWTVVRELGGVDAIDLLDRDARGAYLKYAVPNDAIQGPRSGHAGM